MCVVGVCGVARVQPASQPSICLAALYHYIILSVLVWGLGAVCNSVARPTLCWHVFAPTREEGCVCGRACV